LAGRVEVRFVFRCFVTGFKLGRLNDECHAENRDR
jgi:hypothetical protein